jgi:hypothetical protein
MKNLLFLVCTILLSINLTTGQGSQQDSTIVNGFAYNDTVTNPLQDVRVYISKRDTTGLYVLCDSVNTDLTGKFSIKLIKGFYYFWPYLESYTNTTDTEIELIDSVLVLYFVFIRPEISVNRDTILLSGPDYDEHPVSNKIIITNEGSGKLIYSSVLFLEEKLPPDVEYYLEQISQSQNRKKSTTDLQLEEGNWKLLFKDDRDQDSGHHDLNETLMQVEDDMFYIKATFYDTIRSFDHFFYTFAVNSDRDTSTGTDNDGIDYVIIVTSNSGVLNSFLVHNNYGNWDWVADAIYNDLDSTKNYIAIGYPSYLFENFDIMLAYVSVRPAMEDYSYFDNIPQWYFDIPMLFSIESNPSIKIDKLYAEVTNIKQDTLTLITSPEFFLENDIDSFYIALLCNDQSNPLVIIHVQYIPWDCCSNISLFVNQPLSVINSPNPFTISTRIEYYLNKAGYVKLTIYDIQGKIVKILVDQLQDEGSQVVEWNATDNYGNPVNAGIYLYIIQTKSFRIKGKLTLIK